jgi:predicted transcriptional regulator
MQPTTTHEDGDGLLSELASLRDDIRVRVHLAGMEAKDEWSRIESRLWQLEEQITQGKGASHRQTAALGADLRDAMRGLRARLKRPALDWRVGEVMCATPRACRAADPIRRAVQIMWDFDCGVVPVVDANARPVAMVTDRDLAMALYTRGSLSLEAPVASVMSREIHLTSADATVHEAIATMAERQVRRVAVVDDEGALVGVLSIADLARRASEHGGTSELAVIGDTLGAICRRPSDG